MPSAGGAPNPAAPLSGRELTQARPHQRSQAGQPSARGAGGTPPPRKRDTEEGGPEEGRARNDPGRDGGRGPRDGGLERARLEERRHRGALRASRGRTEGGGRGRRAPVSQPRPRRRRGRLGSAPVHRAAVEPTPALSGHAASGAAAAPSAPEPRRVAAPRPAIDTGVTALRSSHPGAPLEETEAASPPSDGSTETTRYRELRHSLL